MNLPNAGPFLGSGEEAVVVIGRGERLDVYVRHGEELHRIHSIQMDPVAIVDPCTCVMCQEKKDPLAETLRENFACPQGLYNEEEGLAGCGSLNTVPDPENPGFFECQDCGLYFGSPAVPAEE